jgi:hypothetical protein
LFLFDEMGFSIKMRGVCGCVVLFLLCFFFCCFYSCHFLFWWNDIFLVVRAVVLIILDLDSDKKKYFWSVYISLYVWFISPCIFEVSVLRIEYGAGPLSAKEKILKRGLVWFVFACVFLFSRGSFLLLVCVVSLVFRELLTSLFCWFSVIGWYVAYRFFVA